MKHFYVMGFLTLCSMPVLASGNALLEKTCHDKMGKDWVKTPGAADVTARGDLYYPKSENLLSRKLREDDILDAEELQKWFRDHPGIQSVTLEAARREFVADKHNSDAYNSVVLVCTYQYKSVDGTTRLQPLRMPLKKDSTCPVCPQGTKWKNANNMWIAPSTQERVE